MKKEKMELLEKIIFILLIAGVLVVIHFNNGISSYIANYLMPSYYSIPAIDVHEHIALGENQTADLIRIMDKLNISKMVLLDTPSVTFGKDDKFGDYDQNVEIQLKMKAQYPGRFLVLYTYPPWDTGGPNKIEKYYKEGIDGLKFYNGVIYNMLGPINSTAMYRAYEKARELNLSVLIHVESQDSEQLAEFEQVLRDFPNVTFICPHMCAAESHLDLLETLLDKYPNLYTDVSAWQRVGTFAVKMPDEYRQFIIKHSDRIMYATDLVKSNDVNDQLDAKAWFACERDLLEKGQFSCFLEDGVLRGLHLPHDVLVQIYQLTPKKVYANA